MPNMVTLDIALRAYCESKSLPEPSKEDFENCGRMVNTHFKRFWAIKLPPGIIQNSGFVKTSTSFGEFVIQFYPNEFEPEMHKRFDVYYSKKGEKSVPQPTLVEEKLPKKERKRIPAKPTKIQTFKPVNPNL